MSWPDSLGQELARRRREHRAAREHDLAAVVVPPDLRVDARRGRVRARVDVRDEADGRAVVAADRLERREDVAVLGQLDVGEPEPAELVGEEPREVELLGRARIGLRRAIGLRVDARVANEPVEHVLGELRGERRSVRGLHGRESTSRVAQTRRAPT